MSKSKNNSESDAEQEAVLMALDQLSQTVDVMRDVVARLKRRVEAGEPARAALASGQGPGPNPKNHKQKHSEKEAPESSTRQKPVVLH